MGVDFDEHLKIEDERDRPIIPFHGHALRVVKREVMHPSYPKIVTFHLSCRSHCCTIPYGIDLVGAEKQLKEILGIT